MAKDDAKDVEYDANGVETPATVVNLLQEQARQLGVAKQALRKVQLLSSIEIAKIIAKDALEEMKKE